MSKPVVETLALTRQFGNFMVIDGVQFSIDAGKLFAAIFDGRPGCTRA